MLNDDLYFYTGGLGGASAGLAFLAGAHGEKMLARRCWAIALAGVAASPALLVSDLGMPSRFLNMLRLVKVTSPMSIGSWLLAASGAATTLAATEAWTGRPRRLGRAAKPLAAAAGMPLSTYTAVLIANTAVPVWHEARTTLPAVFAASAAASAGAAAIMVTPPRQAGAARRAMVAGAALELAATRFMEHQLGELGAPYHQGASGRLGRAANGCTAAGAVLGVTKARRSRRAAMLAGALVSAGAVLERWSVFEAGFASAADPAATVAPQRRRAGPPVAAIHLAANGCRSP